MYEVREWAGRHGVMPGALEELLDILTHPLPPKTKGDGKSEAAVQAEIRLDAPRLDGLLWRNNVGVLTDDGGIPVRFGLANDSKKVNRNVKSSDLIGVLPLRIEPEHVGRTVGIFAAIECKRGGWNWAGSPKEQAQHRYLMLVAKCGGIAGFARSTEDFRSIVTAFWGNE